MLLEIGFILLILAVLFAIIYCLIAINYFYHLFNVKEEDMKQFYKNQRRKK